MSSSTRAALLPLALVACVLRPTDGTGAGATDGTGAPATTGAGSTSSADTTGSGPGTTDPVVTTTGASGSTTGTSEPATTSNMTVPFIPAFDNNWPSVECDVWAEDCPRGEKCMPWVSDGGGSWNATKCVPIVPDPDGLGEPCTVLGAIGSGEDTCDQHMMCWQVDPDTLAGVCVAMCVGTPDSPACDVPGTTCKLSGDGVVNLCLPDCEPLAQDCPDGDACVPDPNDPSRFLCAVDASGDEGQALDPCEFANACDPGLMCAPSDWAAACEPMVSGCCLPFCDTAQPNTCPGQGLACLPYHEQGQAPPGQETLGVCRSP